MKKSWIGRCCAVALIVSVMVIVPSFAVYAQSVTPKAPVAQGSLQKINKYFSTQTITYDDGSVISRAVINGPPKPPVGYELERTAVALPEPNPEEGANTLTVPAYQWVFGCSAVSGSMIAGYYDRTGFPDIYTGPTGGGVMPLTEDASWKTWNDGYETYPNNPLIASHNGLDGRTTKGSIDDYWVQYGSSTSDPYITGGWTQHAWGAAIGDYMKTSQSAYGNTDGSTTFYTWNTSADQLTCTDMESYEISDKDGTYGRKLFYEAKGYTVTDCYNQKTDNNAGGFSFAQYKAEIDAGHPVLLNLKGHSIVGVGYDTSSNTVYIHDTWDNDNHTMTWGGSYSGMQLLSVSVVNLEASATETTLTVTMAGTGTGTISATGLTCNGSTCTGTYDYSTAVAITATPSPGSTFGGWTGCDSTSGTVCNVTMNNNKSVTATFNSCTYIITPSSKPFPVNGGNVSVKVTASGATSCAQPDLTPSASWITAAFTSAGWKNNKGTVKITAAKSTTSFQRTGSVDFAGGGVTFDITQSPVICTITKLLPGSHSFPVDGGEGTFDITLSASDCPWTATPSVDWIYSDGSGTGNGTISYTVDTNDTGRARTGKITVTLANGKTKIHTVKEQK